MRTDRRGVHVVPALINADKPLLAGLIVAARHFLGGFDCRAAIAHGMAAARWPGI
jgi:hypothetical protein